MSLAAVLLRTEPLHPLSLAFQAMNTEQFTARTMPQWRARLAVMASRGEVDGPRVEECKRALSWYRARAFIDRLVSEGVVPDRDADRLVAALSGAPLTPEPAGAVLR